ncbi:MAG TPA: alpha/beta fold hydrolase [Vicinamibacteria bacterium]|nr:alpha/beta fold hydrolase [Vicinamibacteria bacterium]
MRRTLALTLLALGLASTSDAQEAPSGDVSRQIEALQRRVEAQSYALDQLQKKIDDVLWFDRVGDVAEIDKVYVPTVPVPKQEETYGIANARHPFRMWTYVFVPKGADPASKRPLLVLPHGGVHADFTTYHTHIVRELMKDGYVVLAPEYRGSTGYGREYQEAIDYGGLEVDDVVAARDWAVATLGAVDASRVGILGWSHGGLIALMAAFDHPDKFQAAYAGVPVSDLVARMGYQTESYRRLFSAPYHIGKTAGEAVDEYRRRSPVTHVQKLKVPLLVHTNTNDRDVNVVEVQSLITALKAAGKDFEHKIYEDAPGGHSFNRMDYPLARESRAEVYRFLARHLKK